MLSDVLQCFWTDSNIEKSSIYFGGVNSNDQCAIMQALAFVKGELLF